MVSVPYSLYEEGRPQALDTPPPADNADESGWGVKKIERANTLAEQAGVPSGVPHAPRKYMSNVLLTIGESLRLGRTTSERGG